MVAGREDRRVPLRDAVLPAQGVEGHLGKEGGREALGHGPRERAAAAAGVTVGVAAVKGGDVASGARARMGSARKGEEEAPMMQREEEVLAWGVRVAWVLAWCRSRTAARPSSLPSVSRETGRLPLCSLPKFLSLNFTIHILHQFFYSWSIKYR